MKKDDHLKIVNKLETEIRKLQKRIGELKIESTKYEFDAKLHLFIAEQRNLMITEMKEHGLKNMNYMAAYDKKVQDYQKQVANRLNIDDEKFNQLREYIRDAFPDATMKPINMNFPKSKNASKKDLSNTFIGEGGEVYAPHHVVDIAIMIMQGQIKKLNEILGGDDNDSDEY